MPCPRANKFAPFASLYQRLFWGEKLDFIIVLWPHYATIGPGNITQPDLAVPTKNGDSDYGRN